MTRPATALAIAVALLLVPLAAACAGSSPKEGPAYSGLYISLGDSIAAGNGASDPARTSFVALLAHDEGDLQVLQLAKPGATTRDVLDTQMRPALDAIASKKIAFITIAIGGNDLAALVPNAACTQEPLPPSCPLDSTLAGVERNLNLIMGQLRAADADVPIVLLAYPNFFSGTEHPFEAPAARVLPKLDDVIRHVAEGYPHTQVADATHAFDGKGRTLTHVLDPKFDPHPTDAGHRVIAGAFVAALTAERDSGG
ncbi:MAG TPA: SGNH/GDSL hydrolase family protein [Dehalococcoidia bacterium]|nr:SGNH/GDSL hydrolase family protein [Dehalococcoidia bacterium]